MMMDETIGPEDTLAKPVPPGALPLIGRVLNAAYVIDSFERAGGMGQVFGGRNLETGSKVAIKVILPRFANDAEFMAKFRREAQIMERISHEALVKYRTLNTDPVLKLPYLVTDFISGKAISDVLIGVPCQPDTVRSVLRRLASGLSAAHAAGVIHQDLSPDNVILHQGFVEKAIVIDFGISIDLQAEPAAARGFAGKYAFAPPEAFGRFDGKIGPWSDVYSLALTVLALARGENLNMGQNETIIQQLERRQTVPDLDWLGGNLKSVFRPMLMPDPRDRLSSMAAVLEALDVTFDPHTLNTGEKTSAKPVIAPQPDIVIPPPAQVVRRRPAWLIPGVAAGVVAAAAAAWFATRPAPAPAPVAPAYPPWAQAAPAVAAAIDAVSCGDVEVAGTPADGVVKLAGWMRSDTVLPATAAGWRINATGVDRASIARTATCTEFMSLRRGLGPAVRRLPLHASEVRFRPGAAKDVSMNLQIDAPATQKIYWRVWLRGDAEKPESPAMDVPQGLRTFLLKAEPADHLVAVVSGVDWAHMPHPLNPRCVSGGCAFGSAWVRVRPAT